MILIFTDLLKLYGFHPPAAFSYTSTRMMLALLTSLLITLLMGNGFIRKLKELKIGEKVRSEEYGLIGKLHEKKAETPTMGGVLILFAMVASLLLWMDLTHVFTLILFIATLILGLVGGVDDYLKLTGSKRKGLSAKAKLACQGAIALMITAYLIYPPCSNFFNAHTCIVTPTVKMTVAAQETLSLREYAGLIYIPFFKEPVLQFSGIGLLLTAILIFLVIAGSSNAVNLTDGLDGLAAGCLIVVASCLAAFAFLSNHLRLAEYLNILYIEGSGEIAIYLSAFVGGCLGFLWFNGFPAQVFMGDVGSLTLGGVLGVSAVLLRREFLLFIIGGVFVAEALSVILQVGSYRYRSQRRIFLCAPLHHHFEYKGWPETKVVMRFWIIGLLLALLGMVSLKLQ